MKQLEVQTLRTVIPTFLAAVIVIITVACVTLTISIVVISII